MVRNYKGFLIGSFFEMYNSLSNIVYFFGLETRKSCTMVSFLVMFFECHATVFSICYLWFLLQFPNEVAVAEEEVQTCTLLWWILKAEIFLFKSY